MPWHMQDRLRDKELVLESVGLQQARDSQGVVVLRAAEDAGRRPPKTVDLVTYWIGALAITPSGDEPMNDFVPVVSNKVNLASLTLGRCTFFRMGDWLQVIGSFAYVPVDPFNDMIFDMTPPYAHTFHDLNGDFFAHNYWLMSAPEGGTVVNVYFSNAGIEKLPGTAAFMYWVRIPE